MWYKNMGRTYFCFVTIHTFTDRRTGFLWLDRLHAMHAAL